MAGTNSITKETIIPTSYDQASTSGTNDLRKVEEPGGMGSNNLSAQEARQISHFQTIFPNKPVGKIHHYISRFKELYMMPKNIGGMTKLTSDMMFEWCMDKLLTDEDSDSNPPDTVANPVITGKNSGGNDDLSVTGYEPPKVVVITGLEPDEVDDWAELDELDDLLQSHQSTNEKPKYRDQARLSTSSDELEVSVLNVPTSSIDGLKETVVNGMNPGPSKKPDQNVPVSSAIPTSSSVEHLDSISKSFDVSRGDMYSSTLLDSSDSLSSQSLDSLDSLSDHELDELPTIPYPRNTHRGSFNGVLKVSDYLGTPPKPAQSVPSSSTSWRSPSASASSTTTGASQTMGTSSSPLRAPNLHFETIPLPPNSMPQLPRTSQALPLKSSSLPAAPSLLRPATKSSLLSMPGIAQPYNNVFAQRHPLVAPMRSSTATLQSSSSTASAPKSPPHNRHPLPTAPFKLSPAKLKVSQTLRHPIVQTTSNLPPKSASDSMATSLTSTVSTIPVISGSRMSATPQPQQPRQVAQTFTIQSTHKITVNSQEPDDRGDHQTTYIPPTSNITVELVDQPANIEVHPPVSENNRNTSRTNKTKRLKEVISSLNRHYDKQYGSQLGVPTIGVAATNVASNVDIDPPAATTIDLSSAANDKYETVDSPVAGTYSAQKNNTVLDLTREQEPPKVVDETTRIKNEVLELFPDVEPNHLHELCIMNNGPMAVNNICAHLLDTNYPKTKTAEPATNSEAQSTENKSTIDYYTDSPPISDVSQYSEEMFQLLCINFDWISAGNIRWVISRFGRYAQAHKVLHDVWKEIVKMLEDYNKDAGMEGPFMGYSKLEHTCTIEYPKGTGMLVKPKFKLLTNSRSFYNRKLNVNHIHPQLKAELHFVNQKIKESKEEDDYKMAISVNEQEYETEGQCIECGCCYTEYPFEFMVQCYEGHLFCETCLSHYARESVFGQGKADLKCMTGVCEAAFPKSQLQKALPTDVFNKYEDRVAEENINLADLGDLVQCPSCEFRACLDVNARVFSCQNPQCMKLSCRHCQVDWEEHFGKKCSEVEKKDETKLRLEYEEKMTQAKVRVCHRCKAQFTKEDGCNKMTCRCGAKQCYICRKPDIDYGHFCRHPKDPGKACAHCKDCSLWTNPDEDDNRAISEIQKLAEEEKKLKGFSSSTVVGVPEKPPAKKLKTH